MKNHWGKSCERCADEYWLLQKLLVNENYSNYLLKHFIKIKCMV